MTAALAYELDFWGDCLDTLGEERKHLVYAPLMGIDFDVRDTSVIDIGSGPVSMLLKCRNRGEGCMALDPLMGEFPTWVRARYREARVAPLALAGEDLELLAPRIFDEAWIANVLQHVEDPARVVANARSVARLVRLFEWVDIPAYDGHPNELRQEDLEEWLGAPGSRLTLNTEGCVGTAFMGVFPGLAASI